MAKPNKKKLITFDTLQIEMLGPRTMAGNRTVYSSITKFLNGVQGISQTMLRDNVYRAKITPELKGFRLKFQ